MPAKEIKLEKTRPEKNRLEENAAAKLTAAREVTVTRTFAAPRALVFQAWVDPARLALWWGPHGYTNPVCDVDARPGGRMHIVMRAPDGVEYPMTAVFSEIVASERLVFSAAALDAQGDAILKVQTTVTFTDHDGGTKVSVHANGVGLADQAVAMLAGMQDGWTQSLQKLGDVVAGNEPVERPFVITRAFDAPRELVFAAWTDSRHLARWFGPKGVTVTQCRMDLRPGGSFHYCMRTADGQDMWGKWVFREIVAPERIVLVSSFSDAEGKLTRHPLSQTWPLETLSTTTFSERGGKTTVTIEWAPMHSATQAERDTFNAAHAGMQQGWTGTLDQLAEYLTTV